jgi:hypothetical protein
LIGIGKSQLAGASGSGSVFSFHLLIPHSRISTLGTNPLQLIAGVPNKIIFPTVAQSLFSIVNGNTPWTLNTVSQLVIGYNSTGTPLFTDPVFGQLVAPSPGVLDQPSPFVSQFELPGFPGPDVTTIGKPIYLATENQGTAFDNLTGGNQDFVIDFNYQIVDVTK